MRLVGRTALLSLTAAALAAPVFPDEIFLHGGGRVTGVIVERTRDTVTLETAPGRLTLSMKRVERIVESRSAVEVFQERAAALDPGDVAGWAELARWAADRDLLTHSREAWQRVLAADPSHPGANEALGRVQLDGDWVSEDEAYRARGYVRFDGRWVTPAEHEALVRERAAEEMAERESRETQLRVREAEARAREAEARAREAESSEVSVPDGSIPIGWGWGGGVPLLPSHDGDRHDGDGHDGDRHDGDRHRGGSDGSNGGRPQPTPSPGRPEPTDHGAQTPAHPTHAPSAIGPASTAPPSQVGSAGGHSQGESNRPD